MWSDSNNDSLCLAFDTVGKWVVQLRYVVNMFMYIPILASEASMEPGFLCFGRSEVDMLGITAEPNPKHV